ncbi:hypothetical protein SDC9_179274 [bioreactor metagenome]|uniref:Uncharacterized protein n=1 Tax=bioreactor metagenome TaxID=1076179 RepID=A0A645H1D6_9ZZZZ
MAKGFKTYSVLMEIIVILPVKHLVHNAGVVVCRVRTEGINKAGIHGLKGQFNITSLLVGFGKSANRGVFFKRLITEQKGKSMIHSCLERL